MVDGCDVISNVPTNTFNAEFRKELPGDAYISLEPDFAKCRQHKGSRSQLIEARFGQLRRSEGRPSPLFQSDASSRYDGQNIVVVTNHRSRK